LLEATIPTAAIQRQILAHEATIEGAPAYNLLAGAALVGPVDVERLAAAFAGLVADQPALRACMVPTADGLAQSIAPPAEFIGGITVADTERGEAVEQAREFARQPIDTFSRPTLRLGVFEEPPGPGRSRASALAVVTHHAFTDGQSLAMLCAELGLRYADPEARGGGLGVVEWEDLVEEYRREIAVADRAAGGALVTGSGPPQFRSGLGEIVIERLGERRSGSLPSPWRCALASAFSGLSSRCR
jgi:GNAT superfamily N-acetyltransferase